MANFSPFVFNSYTLLFVVTNCKYKLKTCWCSVFSYKIIISSTTEKCFLHAGFQFVNRGHSLCTNFHWLVLIEKGKLGDSFYRSISADRVS